MAWFVMLLGDGFESRGNRREVEVKSTHVMNVD